MCVKNVNFLLKPTDPDQVEEFMENHYNSESGDSEIFIVTYDNEEGDS
jgi:hypothetical protein